MPSVVNLIGSKADLSSTTLAQRLGKLIDVISAVSIFVFQPKTLCFQHNTRNGIEFFLSFTNYFFFHMRVDFNSNLL